ncbi:hypothetical protein [Companilactobacillus sp. FL22-1]|uniref:hypothetical protein n=1 Tax=Companilactobacillus sp. FL22-1 TaxID=3373892 RepID=UPI003753EC41
MMRKILRSLVLVGVLLGFFCMMNLIVQADTVESNQEVNFKVYKSGSNSISPVDNFFTRRAAVKANDNGSYQVSLLTKDTDFSDLNILSIDGHKPATQVKGNNLKSVSFEIDKLSDLKKSLTAVVQTKVFDSKIDQTTVTITFDFDSLRPEGAKNPAMSGLKQVTKADKKSSTSSNLNVSSTEDKIISTPNKTQTTTTKLPNLLSDIDGVKVKTTTSSNQDKDQGNSLPQMNNLTNYILIVIGIIIAISIFALLKGTYWKGPK